jgi:hypothetical protein
MTDNGGNVENECEMFGHDDELMGDEDGMRTYTCRRCGAEWWEDDDDD